MWAVIAVLFVLVLAGGTLGTLLAFGVLTPDPTPVADNDEPELPRAEVEPPPPPPEDPVVDPPAQGAQAQPATTAAPTVPSTPAAPTLRLSVTVEGPSTAQIFIDDVQWGTSPFNGELRRDPVPETGQPPTLHLIEARAEGWHADPQEYAFTGTELSPHFTMQPVRSRNRSTPPIGTPTPRPVEPRPRDPLIPVGTIDRPQPPPPRPPPNDLLRPF
jgi:hypothetical protein